MEAGVLDPDDPDLHDEIELACLDAMGGDPPGPLLATRIQRACEGVLRRRGVQGARVEVRSTAKGTAVQILLPRPDKTVSRVVLSLG